MDKIFDKITLIVYKDYDVCFYRFKDSNCGYLKCYGDDGAGRWAIQVDDRYYLLSQEEMFSKLDKTNKMNFMFALDDIDKLKIVDISGRLENGQHYYCFVAHRGIEQTFPAMRASAHEALFLKDLC